MTPHRQIDMSVRVLSVLVGAEVLVAIVLGAVIAIKGGDFGTSSLSLQPFTPGALFAGSLPIALHRSDEIGVLAVAVANFDLLIGDIGFLSWFLSSLLVVAAIVGAVAAQLLKKRTPALFASMGTAHNHRL